METELYTWFSLSDFHMPSVETLCTHSNLGSRNPTSIELQVLKHIQSQQHKNPQHNICPNMKWGCSVNTGVFLWLVCFLPVHILLWCVGKAVGGTAGHSQSCLCVVCILHPLSPHTYLTVCKRMAKYFCETRKPRLKSVAVIFFFKASGWRNQRISGVPQKGRNQLYYKFLSFAGGRETETGERRGWEF